MPRLMAHGGYEMNVMDMTDAQIYEHGIKVLTKNLGLTETERFLYICKPQEADVAVAWRTLSHLKMEKIEKKVFREYAAKHPVPENKHIRNLSALPDMTLYKFGLDAILDALGLVGMARFIRIRKPNTIDYTAERHKWLDKLDKETILKGIQQAEQEYLEEQVKGTK